MRRPIVRQISAVCLRLSTRCGTTPKRPHDWSVWPVLPSECLTPPLRLPTGPPRRYHLLHNELQSYLYAHRCEKESGRIFFKRI